MSAFAPTISLPNIETAFDSKGTAMVPVTTGRGNKKLGKPTDQRIALLRSLSPVSYTHLTLPTILRV